MRLELLLPNISGLILERVEMEEDCLKILTISQKESSCPICKTVSNRVHSSYTREVADLSWASFVVKIIVKVHKFFCKKDTCERKIFSQRFDGILPYARRTERQRDKLISIGMASGGNVGSKLSKELGLPVSASTILRLLNTPQETEVETPRVLGIDDWAIRKGQVYGTIMVDLEKRKPIDLILSRETDAVAKWLKTHPGIEIISRDRATAYAEAINQGAPNAIQVADRWHLIKNMTDALKRLMNKHNQASRKVARQIAQTEQAKITEALKPDDSCNDSNKKDPILRVKATELKGSPPSKYELLFREVKELQKKGVSQREISRRLKINRSTVSRYAAYDEYPKKITPPSKISKTSKFNTYLSKRWQEGERNYHQLWREIKEQGFDGSFINTYRYLVKNFTKENKDNASKSSVPIKVYSARRLSFLMCREAENLKPKEQHYLDLLFEYCPQAKQASELAKRYRDILVNKKSDLLDQWIEDTLESGKEVLMTFAKNLMQDYDAIKNACTLEWSNGQVEGQVNRLKNIKRQMYGRGSFELLKKKVLSDW